MLKDIAFCHLQKGLNINGKKLMDTAIKTGMDPAKTASKMVLQKTEKLQEIGLETK